MEDLSRHAEILTSWLPDSETAREALGNVRLMVIRGEALVGLLTKLDSSGFSPPRKCYTASTTEGDTVQVLVAHREFYSDFMAPSLMADLQVIKKQPGKGGGLVVVAADGSKMRVAMAHVVKTS